MPPKHHAPRGGDAPSAGSGHHRGGGHADPRPASGGPRASGHGGQQQHAGGGGGGARRDRGGAHGSGAAAAADDGSIMLVNTGSTAAGPRAAAPREGPTNFPLRNFSATTHPTLANDLQAHTHVVATLFVNSWTGSVAYGKGPWGTTPDVVINLDASTPMALNGDIVLIRLSPQSTWEPVKQGEAAPSRSVQSAVAAAPEEVQEAASPVATTHDPRRLPDGREIVSILSHEGGAAAPGASSGETTAVRHKMNHAQRITEQLGASTRIPAAWPAHLQPRGDLVQILERHFETSHACRFASTEPDGVTPTKTIRPDRHYRFKPYNKAYPILCVNGSDIPSELRENPGDFLFQVEIVADATSGDVAILDRRFPQGRVIRSLGKAGTAQGESEAIASCFAVKATPFSEEVENCIVKDFRVPPIEQLDPLVRRDLRQSEFVCSIDPVTARDLDDAMSITRIEGGYRIGVHIADVSHFVPVGSALDLEARERATSVYFVERVVPMLPHKLCEDYCSLNAGVDKFAFSGIWEFNNDGTLRPETEWFGQSVIRNRCRMTYDDAQRIIDGDLSGDSLKFVNETLPRPQLAARVVRDVQMMFDLATKFRAARKARGALSLNKAKIKFLFEDMNSRLAPVGFTVERSKEANWMVEEFMLLANFRVAEKVVQFLPECALLRKHDAPKLKSMEQLTSSALKCGIVLKTSSSHAIAECLEALKDHPDIDAIRTMTTMCMQQAKYVNSGDAIAAEEDKAQEADAPRNRQEAEAEMKRQMKVIDRPDFGAAFRHYALAAYAYCHFTSPIRRYADLVTHRQLLMALDLEREVKRQELQGDLRPVDRSVLPHRDYYLHPDDVSNIATHCNEKKEAARKAGDASIQLFLCLYMEAQRLKLQQSEGGAASRGGVVAAATMPSLAEAAAAASSGAPPRARPSSAAAAAARLVSAPAPSVPSAAVVLYAVVVRVKKETFNLNCPSVGLDCELYHNSQSQKWHGENKVDAADLSFVIDWGRQPGAPASAPVVMEKASLFSKFVVTLRVTRQGYLKVDMLVHPPWERAANLVTQLQETL